MTILGISKLFLKRQTDLFNVCFPVISNLSLKINICLCILALCFKSLQYALYVYQMLLESVCDCYATSADLDETMRMRRLGSIYSGRWVS